MIRVRLMLGIVVSAGICKIIGTVSGFMNMKSVEGRNIFRSIEREMEKFRIENDSVIGCVVEFYHAGYFGISLVTTHQCDRIWRRVDHVRGHGVWVG